jgi:hypothetical protein
MRPSAWGALEEGGEIGPRAYKACVLRMCVACSALVPASFDLRCCMAPARACAADASSLPLQLNPAATSFPALHPPWRRRSAVSVSLVSVSLRALPERRAVYSSVLDEPTPLTRHITGHPSRPPDARSQPSEPPRLPPPGMPRRQRLISRVLPSPAEERGIASIFRALGPLGPHTGPSVGPTLRLRHPPIRGGGPRLLD